MKTEIPEWRADAPAGKFLSELMTKRAIVPNPLTPVVAPAQIGQAQQRGANPMMQFIAPQAQVRWLGPGVAWYSPERVEQIFRQALSGDLTSQWELFDLMESTSPRLTKCLNQLKDDVISTGLTVQPWKAKDSDPTDEAKRRAAFVDEALNSMQPVAEADENDFEDTIRDLLDARGKGHAVLETSWEVRQLSMGPGMVPRATRWVHPAWYGYEHGPGDANLKLRLGPYNEYMSTVTQGPQTWMPFPKHKFLIGVCKNKSGHPLGSAMLHNLGFWWAAANFSAEWFLNLAQVFGQPFRWATYDPNMTPGDQSTLASTLANMGSSAWAMFPAGTQMDFKEAMKDAGETPQMALLNYFDKQCDLLILRQTLSSDVSKEGGSRSQGEVHERILGSAEQACSKWACKTIGQLVKSIMLLNFGDLSECPYLAPPIEEEDESSELCTNLDTLASAGLEPTDDALSDLSTRVGFELQRKAEPSPNGSEDIGLGTDLQTKEARRILQLMAKAGIPEASDAVNEIAARQARAVGDSLRESFGPAVKIIRDSKSPAECEARLKTFFADWRPGQIVKALEPALQAAAANGAVEGSLKSKV